MSMRRAGFRARLAAVVIDSCLDARAALRALLRAPTFAITAVVTLTVAIGLNVTVFAVTDAVLNRGFPLVQDNSRLLYMQERYPDGACCINFADFVEWQAQAASFDGLAFVDGTQVTLSDSVGGRSVDTSAASLTANMFDVLGVQPLLGRDFAASDEEPGAPRVVVLNHRFWEARFGGRADIVGSTIAIDGEPATVIGVMPARFDFPSRHSLWLPLARARALEQRVPNGFLAVGRLAAGVTQATARSELEAINRRLAADYPATNRDVVPTLSTYAELFMGPDAPAVYGAAWAAAWLVLLIACANVANLTLARALGRSRELATRLALGAARWRLGRQLVMESVLLAAVSAMIAWPVAGAAVAAWARATDSQYQIIDHGLDGTAFFYLVGVALVAAAIFGVAPVARVLRFDVDSLARTEARGTRGRRDKRLVATLVTVQMTLAIVLLGGAGVLARSFWNIVGADVGVRAPHEVLIGWVSMPRGSLQSAAEQAAFFEALRERLATVPGVTSAAVSNSRPVNVTGQRRFDIEGRPVDPDVVEAAPVLTAGAGYFATIGATTLNGREFGIVDGESAPLTAVVNERFVAEYFNGEDAVGRRVRLYDGTAAGEWRKVVGVVSNVMQSEPTRQRFVPLVYVPFAQAPERSAWFFARVAAPSAATTAAVGDAVRRFHPDLTLEDLSTLEASFRFIRDRMDLAHAELGKYATLAPTFAAVALLLAGVGLYAVVTYAAGQRTKEIGVRMAVGARQDDIRRLVMRQEMVPVAVGLACGFAVSFAANRVLQSQLVGVSPFDPVTLLATGALLVAVALIACHVPARRAMRVDPVIALRND
jgi:putative ABC transport system permease protein